MARAATRAARSTTDDSTTLAGSTLEENTCVYGGGLYNADDATVDHVLFQTNSAGTDGGSIYNEDSLTMSPPGSITAMPATMAADSPGRRRDDHRQPDQQNTAGNTGGGIYNDDTISLSKSSVVQNKPDNCAPLGSVTGCFG